MSVFSSLGVRNGEYVIIRALSSSVGSREKRKVDFTVPNPFITIPLDGLNSTALGKLEMAELSPDLQYFTVLNTTGCNNPPATDHPGYILPQGHFWPSAFRLHTYSYANQRYWSMDRIFQYGEEIRIKKPDLIIKGKESKAGKEVSIFVW